MDIRIRADIALKNFGSDALAIHLSLAKASVQVIRAFVYVFIVYVQSQVLYIGRTWPIFTHDVEEHIATIGRT